MNKTDKDFTKLGEYILVDNARFHITVRTGLTPPEDETEFIVKETFMLNGRTRTSGFVLTHKQKENLIAYLKGEINP